MNTQKKQGLSSNERIKSKKDFDDLYTSGKVLFSKDQKLKAIYIISDNTAEVKIAAVVSKKSGNAVWRNRVKRLIKEAYRLNKEEIIKASQNAGKNLKIIFSAFALSEKKNKKIELKDISPGVLELMNSVKKKL